MSNYTQDKANAFDMDSPASAGDDLHYGPKPAAGVPRSERIIAKPIPLDELYPDPAQPRHIVPAVIAARYSTRRAQVKAWRSAAEEQLGKSIDIVSFLNERDGYRPPVGHTPLVKDFLSLLWFAITCNGGLINPITYSTDANGRKVIETGERRWTAYHVLAEWYDPKFNRIEARDVGTFDEFRRATENTARRDLSAIGITRQLALLIMASYQDDPDVTFKPYDAFSFDQDFYAQVKDINIKRGWGERVSTAMGDMARSQLSRYKQLLDIPRDAWARADETGASLNDLLGYVDAARGTNHQRSNADNQTNVAHEQHSTPDKDVSNGSSLIHDIDRAAFPPSQRGGEGPGVGWHDPAVNRIPAEPKGTVPPDGRSGETYTIGIPPAPRGYDPDEWEALADDEREMILDDVTTNGSGGKLPDRIPVPQVTRRSVIDQRARVFLSSLQELQQWHDSTNVNAVAFPANLLTWDSQQLAQQVVHQGWTRAHLQADYDAFVNHMDNLLTEYRAHVIELMGQHLDMLEKVIDEVNQQQEENN